MCIRDSILAKDIFSLRDGRVVNAYHKISLRNIELTVPTVPLRERVYLRIVSCMYTGMAEIRFWYDKKLVGTAKVRNCLLYTSRCV